MARPSRRICVPRGGDLPSSLVPPSGGLRARKEYTLTREGKAVLNLLRRQVEELYREVVLGEDEDALVEPAPARPGRAAKGKRR